MPKLTHYLTWIIVAIALLPLVLVVAASQLFEIDISLLVRDVAAIAGVHPLAGFLSSLGVLLWWMSASVWLFTAMICRELELKDGLWFALASFLLSAYLALDDLFQFHETLAPGLLGVSEKPIYAALGIAVAVYLWRFRSIIGRRDGPLLLLALGLLASAAAADVLLEQWQWLTGGWIFFVEDGLKWLGICSWCAFCFAWCRETLLARLRRGAGS